MKLKQQPEDFQVEELTDLVPGDSGNFALYRLSKRGWTTLDALNMVRRRWRIDHRRLSYGGLKDRHAQTVQYFTIFHGPQRRLTQDGIAVEYLGQVPAAYTSQDMRGNRFLMTLRAVAEAERDPMQQALTEVQAHGVPNYFDDQRFGSVSGGGPFMARALALGQYEEALRLTLTAPYEHDRAAQKRDKALLQQLWGNWGALKERLSRSHARSLVDYLLHHPGDFRGAVERLQPDLRGLYLSAYQSHLWNQMLARWLTTHLRPEQLVPVRLLLGDVPMPRTLTPEQRSELEQLRLPLPSPRHGLADDDARLALLHEVLAADGVSVDQLRLKGLRELFFSKGDRAALCVPAGVHGTFAADERHPDRLKLTLGFDLPRGAYATLIVKRITSPGT
jgi:tRNA pseudouridine13 synthase